MHKFWDPHPAISQQSHIKSPHNLKQTNKNHPRTEKSYQPLNCWIINTITLLCVPIMTGYKQTWILSMLRNLQAKVYAYEPSKKISSHAMHMIFRHIGHTSPSLPSYHISFVPPSTRIKGSIFPPTRSQKSIHMFIDGFYQGISSYDTNTGNVYRRIVSIPF